MHHYTYLDAVATRKAFNNAVSHARSMAPLCDYMAGYFNGKIAVLLVYGTGLTQKDVAAAHDEILALREAREPTC
jgi:hypothetical protein